MYQVVSRNVLRLIPNKMESSPLQSAVDQPESTSSNNPEDGRSSQPDSYQEADSRSV